MTASDEQYAIDDTVKSGDVRYTSELSIHNTTKADYGHYKCIARNDLGEDSNLISLDGTSTFLGCLPFD